MVFIPIYIVYGVYLNIHKYNYFYNIFLFIGFFGYYLYLISFKYLTQKKSVPVFLLIFFIGILSFIYRIIIFIIISLIFKDNCQHITNIFYWNEDNLYTFHILPLELLCISF